MSMRPLTALLLTASLTGSCTAGRPDQTVLVSRAGADPRVSRCHGVDDYCNLETPSQAFRAADGRAATVAATNAVWRQEDIGEPQVECGGKTIRRITYILRAQPASDDTSRQTLNFDDGSAVQLFAESWTTVVDKCSETVGRWEGIEGTFEGRAGTYRWTDDWLQDILVLTDSSDDSPGQAGSFAAVTDAAATTSTTTSRTSSTSQSIAGSGQ